MLNLHFLLSATGHAARRAGEYLLAILTSRSLVVVSTSCAILYGAFWLVALMQANGLISTNLPVPVADDVVLRRAGGELRSAEPSPQELAVRNRALGQSEIAPGDASAGAEQAPLTLEIQSAPPVELWVTDGHGGEIGTNPQTGLVRLQIAGASYSGRNSNPQLVSIPRAEGQYHIAMLGTGNGRFQVSVRVFANDDIDHAVQYGGSGEVFEDTLLETVADVGVDAGQPRLEVSPVRVLVAGSNSQVAGATAELPPPAQPSEAPAAEQPVEPAPPVNVAPRTVFRPRPLPRPAIPLPPLPTLPAIQPDSPQP